MTEKELWDKSYRAVTKALLNQYVDLDTFMEELTYDEMEKNTIFDDLNTFIMGIDMSYLICHLAEEVYKEFSTKEKSND